MFGRLPYNLDLASSDFRNFFELKKWLVRFITNDELQDKINIYPFKFIGDNILWRGHCKPRLRVCKTNALLIKVIEYVI